MQSWLDCHLQYKFTYFDRLSKFYYRANRGDTFGASMHRALQAIYESGGPAATAPEQAVEALESAWASAGYASPNEEQEALETGRKLITGYHERLQQREARTLLIEKQLRWRYDSFTLMGRLDRMDEHPDGTLEVIDYKSGRQEVTPEQVRESIAMTCYALLVRRHYPDRAVRATIVALAGGCEATATWTDDDLDVFEEQAHTVAAQITGREEFPPSYGPVCTGCIYSGICYGKGPIDWEAKRREFEETSGSAL